jgi:cation diffusion facilitator family transporter
VQLVVVLVSGSVALLADTVHNFADISTALPLGLAFWLGRRPPNRRYTYGYGRAEDLAGVFIVLTIAASAAVTGWETVQRFLHPHAVHHLAWVAVAGVVGSAGNELAATYRVRVGRRIGSAALVADGIHARTDGITSLAVVAGAGGVALGWRIADPIVGACITLLIILIARGAARDVYRRVMDSVDPHDVDQIESVLSSVAGIEEVEHVRVRWVGHELQAEVDVISDCELGLEAAHDIAEEAEHRLLHEIPHLARATIHSSPCGHGGRDPHALTRHHRAR